MYQIGEASMQTGLSTKTIRYYEHIGLIPPPERSSNGYRIFAEEDLERLRFIRSARALNFPLKDIDEILAFRDQGEPPCRYVMALMQKQIEEISERIRELEGLSEELRRLYENGQSLPEDVQMKTCICHAIQIDK
jgi:DNA-binding transcriptional MerR regulator